MEKLKKYQQILREYLIEYAAQWSNNGKDTFEVICDTERNHFLMVGLGWSESGRTYFVPFHFDIIDGKVWVQENLTEIEVGEELVLRGIPKSDIVPGLLEPSMRQYSGYAVA
jgi:XisI protein